MKVDFLSVLITVFALVILIIPGFVLKKTKILGDKSDATLSALCLYGCQPMLMFMSFQKTAFSSDIALNMLIVAGLAFAVHFIMIGLMFLIFRSKDQNNKAKMNCLRFASVFSNCGYMGLPFLQTLFANQVEVQGEIMIYAGIVIAVFNILTWSLGVFMMTGDRKQMNFKRAFLNPTVIGLFLGLILFFAIQKPLVQIAPAESTWGLLITKLCASFNFLAEMVTPVAMIVIGIKLANIKIKSLFLDKWAYVVSVNKLILMSVVTMLVVGFLPIDNVAKCALFFCLSMPCATGTVMFAVQFGGDADSAAVFVLLSTILSVLTIPLMFLAFNGIFSVA